MSEQKIIERLTEELEEALKPKWISVKDKLPDEIGEWYLISSACNLPHESVVTMAFLDVDTDGNAMWLVHNDSDRNSGSNEWDGVTHWMPLPPAAEE